MLIRARALCDFGQGVIGLYDREHGCVGETSSTDTDVRDHKRFVPVVAAETVSCGATGAFTTDGVVKALKGGIE